MKTFSKKFLSALFLLIFLAGSIYLYGDIDGRTGRTLKSSTSGCGSCHGSSATTGVSVVISGPDTVTVGQSVQYSLIITRSTKTGAGLDVAVRNGSLTPVYPNTHLTNGEITHSDNLSMTAGTISITFNYNAPAGAVTDTIWADGIATNSGGNSSGDEWNWAQSKRVVVRLPTGISNISSANEFFLSQNYPNPFNPQTNIKIEMIKPLDLTVKVFDNLGNEVQVLHNGILPAGTSILKWNAAGFPSGVYYYTVTGKDFYYTKKMSLVK